MVIELTHPKYQFLDIVQGSLKLKGEDGEITLYQDLVEECCATVVDSTIHIVALLSNQRMIHWHGHKDLLSEDLKTEKQLIKGLQLIADCNGKVHLFYLQQNIHQNDYTLIQRTFTDSWNEQLRVTTNISIMTADYRVCPGLEKYLHLIYVGLEGDTLFYRCFDLENKLWSGAIPLVREECSNPQLYIADGNLLLTWLTETEEGNRLRAIWQRDTWSKPYSLSDIGKDIYEPGISWEKGCLTINWIEGSNLYSRNYEQEWSELKKVSLGEKERKHKTVMIEGSKACCTWLVYEPFKPKVSKIAEPEVKPVEVSEAEVVGEKEAVEATKVAETTKTRESEEEKERRALEMKFWQEAFQLHQEWQELRKDYQAVLQQGKIIEEKLEERLKEIFKQDSKQETNNLENKVTQLAEELQLVNQRVMDVRNNQRSIRQTGRGFEELEQRMTVLESKAPSRNNMEAKYISLEKRIGIVESKINDLTQQIAASTGTTKRKELRAKTLLKRLIWK